jgi:hypothetical protein
MTIRTQFAGLILIAGSLLLPTLAASQTTATEHDKSIDISTGDHVKVQQILLALQRAVAKHDVAAVAALIRYPLRVNPGKRPFTVKSPKAFIARYDEIITPDVTSAIFKQKYENLFANSEGVMIGDGEVWITSSCLDKNCRQTDIKVGTIQDTKNLKP